jgi:hypothetical protein
MTFCTHDDNIDDKYLDEKLGKTVKPKEQIKNYFKHKAKKKLPFQVSVNFLKFLCSFYRISYSFFFIILSIGVRSFSCFLFQN